MVCSQSAGFHVPAPGVDLDGEACLWPPGVGAPEERAVRQVEPRVEHRHGEPRLLDEVAQLGLGRRPHALANLGRVPCGAARSHGSGRRRARPRSRLPSSSCSARRPLSPRAPPASRVSQQCRVGRRAGGERICRRRRPVHQSSACRAGPVQPHDRRHPAAACSPASRRSMTSRLRRGQAMVPQRGRTGNHRRAARRRGPPPSRAARAWAFP